MKTHRDTILGAVVIVIAVALFIASFFIKEFTRTSLGAGFVPQVTAVIFAVLGVLLIVKESAQRSANRTAIITQTPVSASTEEPAAKTGMLTGSTAVVLNILLFAIYLIFLEKIGFVILTPIYLFLQILMLTNPSKYRFGRFALISALVGVLSYYLFVKAFQVMLPNGILS